jgi:formate hydrogenlyase subunit 3/multisubunit Na+/H+ antiporter MnhD subunit
MVNALYIIMAAMAAAFLLGLLKEQWRVTAYAVTLVVLAFMTWVSASWLVAFVWGSATPVEIFTAGTAPPFAINLRMALPEAALTLLVNISGLLAAIYLKDALLARGRRAMAVLILSIMALCGLILTRDIFNLFVFFELIAISTGGLILLSDADDSANALAAGFKYLIVSQAISVCLLLGIVFAYHATGTLNIDDMAASSLGLQPAGAIAFFLILIALIAELKPFPANG